MSSAVRLHTNHRADAHFRRVLEAGLQQTSMHRSPCSCCSSSNTSPQFIASHLIAFAVSYVPWPLNYMATDWSWETTGVMLALPSCFTKRSCSKAGGGERCRSEGVRQGGAAGQGGKAMWRTEAWSIHRSRDEFAKGG